MGYALLPFFPHHLPGGPRSAFPGNGVLLFSPPSCFSFQNTCILKNGSLYLTTPPTPISKHQAPEGTLLASARSAANNPPYLSQLPPKRPSQEAAGSPLRETSQKAGCRKHPPSSRQKVWGSSELDTKPCLVGFSNHVGTEFQGLPQGHRDRPEEGSRS